MNKDIKPLYRKVNTTTRVHHYKGDDAKYDRHTKKGINKNMAKNKHRGLDYTPLFKFLLSKVGQEWDKIYSQAVARLDTAEPIGWMVNLHSTEEEIQKEVDYFIVEKAYYSKLYVDDKGILQVINPNLKNEDFKPSCDCCTHTFNGKVFNHKYEQPKVNE